MKTKHYILLDTTRGKRLRYQQQCFFLSFRSLSLSNGYLEGGIVR